MPEQAASPSLESLYCDHHGWLQAWLRRRLGNSSDAADLAHDTFLRVLGRVQREPIWEPRAYLATIARGLVVSHWRRCELERAWFETLAAQPQAVAPSPEDRALVLETLEQIARMLEGLPARCREIFLLSQMEGLTYPRISAQLGVSVNVVQKDMTHAPGPVPATRTRRAIPRFRIGRPKRRSPGTCAWLPAYRPRRITMRFGGGTMLVPSTRTPGGNCATWGTGCATAPSA